MLVGQVIPKRGKCAFGYRAHIPRDHGGVLQVAVVRCLPLVVERPESLAIITGAFQFLAVFPGLWYTAGLW